MDSLRKKRIQLRRKLRFIVLGKGESWRETKKEVRQGKQKFLKAWAKYSKNSQNPDDFLHSAKELAQVLKKESLQQQKLKKKYSPCMNELKMVERKLGTK